jgi:hypothetical protein
MNPLRALYGGSDRAHHLALNNLIACSLCGIAGAVYIHGMPWLLAAPFGCWIHERWASPDRDLQENRKVRGYWGKYGDRVKHRCRYSHSLLIGTPLRLLYGYWFALPCVVAFPLPSLAFVAGCIASDCAHYALDFNKHFRPLDAIVGKNNPQR